MGSYLISEVERLTGVRGHVLRRWEQKLPLFSPAKDYQGRRSYGERDMETIVRMKHLVYDRGYSEEDAARRIVADAAGHIPDAAELSALREIREQLGGLYLSLKRQRRNGRKG